MEFWEWMTEKYIEWRGKAIGNERSISEFAVYVGVPQPTMSTWMKKEGREPRSQKSIQKLVDIYGLEVYDVLGIARPTNQEVFGLNSLPPGMRSRLESATTEIHKVMEERGVHDAGSPEAEQIAIEIMARHGFEFIGSSEDEDLSTK